MFAFIVHNENLANLSQLYIFENQVKVNLYMSCTIFSQILSQNFARTLLMVTKIISKGINNHILWE